MEILATGEKIKRARIYKGLTLKDLCGERLSVSKMSCIENDKIIAEPDTLRYIADILDLDYSYLTESIMSQIERNTKLLVKRKDIKNYEEAIEYNLQYALDNEYYDLACQLMHLLFLYYLEHEQVYKLQTITSRYYDICNKSALEANYVIFNRDMGRYFYENKEYSQALTYFNGVRESLMNNPERDSELLAAVIYDEICCHVALKSYAVADELAAQLEGLIEKVENKFKRGQMYQILAALYIRIHKDKFETFEKKTYESYEGDSESTCLAMLDFANSMMDKGLKDLALKYIEKGLSLYPKNNEMKRVKYMLNCIGTLVENDILDMAQEICDEALNIAIMLDNIRFIEKAYYYKALILQKSGDYVSSEMYMNLSTDALFKCGNKRERYERYLELGNMYHKLGQVNDSIKYLSLAMVLEKKL
ncbi:helix-turn-helix domain-containing protein [Clostridium thermarum]|uniref:helix-turn-helix domain-containing protein n=1 Tax=Clostridium thermarum TaxID=1716543 RepID=UPI0011227660|nr:helix-turn-helix transcriptional regulator [Clostridium thermarum]